MSWEYGGFLKSGYPQLIHFSRMFHSKPIILGIPHLRKPPISVKAHGFSDPGPSMASWSKQPPPSWVPASIPAVLPWEPPPFLVDLRSFYRFKLSNFPVKVGFCDVKKKGGLSMLCFFTGGHVKEMPLSTMPSGSKPAWRTATPAF